MEPFFVFNPEMESLSALFARNVMAIRKSRELTQPDLISAGIAGGSAHRGGVGQNIQLSTLEKWAKALGTPAWALLHPDFNPANPLVIVTAAQLEEEVQRRVREVLQPLAPLIGGLFGSEAARPDGRSAAKPFPDSPLETGKQGSAADPKTDKKARRS